MTDHEPRKSHRESSHGKIHRANSSDGCLGAMVIICILCFVVALIFNSSLRSFVGAAKDAFTAITWPWETRSSFDADLVGQLEKDATSQVEAAGWNVNINGTYDGYHKAGTVSYQIIDKKDNIVKLYISKGFPDEHIISNGVTVTPSTHDLTLEVGESVDLILAVDGSEEFFASTYGFKAPAYYANIKPEWGDWLEENKGVHVTITGNEASEGYIRFYVYNSDTEEILAYTDVYVVVK